MRDIDIRKRTEWLREFDAAQETARMTLRAVEELISACYVVGNERLGDTLRDYVEVLRESLSTMDTAVSRNIHEEAQEGWNQIGETFKALLEVTAK